MPKGYRVVTLIGGHTESEKQFVYPDSTIVYISNFENGSLNYKNILSLGDSVASKRFENIELMSELATLSGSNYKEETILLNGKMSNGLYWKDIRAGQINVGYINVRDTDKAKFDMAIESFKIK